MNEKLLGLLNGDIENYPHALEEKYARVLNRILELWDTPDIKPYFFELLMDNRDGKRQGFPKDVARDIFNLSNVYDRYEASKNDPGFQPLESGAEPSTGKADRIAFSQISEEFMKAIEAGDVDKVEQMLSSGADLESRDEREWTPLMISAFNGNEKLALVLICSGAQLQVRDMNGYTPLHWTAYNGFDRVVDLLIREGAKVNSRSDFGWTPLMQAATRGHVVVAMKLLAAGANIDDTSADGLTALHKAAANGHEQLVKLLLNNGANRNIKARDGSTAVQLALTNKHEEVVRLLRMQA